MKPAVQHFEISTNDYKKAQEFYSSVFQWDINDHDGNYALISPGDDKSIGGGIGRTRDGQQPSLTFYITVDDIEAYLAKVEKAGGKTVMPLTPIPDVGSCAMFADPDGNVVGLYKGHQA